MTIPLANAGTARVREDNTAGVLEGLDDTIAGNGSTDLLRARGDSEFALGRQTVRRSLLGNGSRASHVLVRRVRARTDEADLELLGPVVRLHRLFELADGSGEIGSERTVDVGLELRQVLYILFR